MEETRLKKLVLNSCLTPISISYIDPLTGLKTDKECACGKCYHCTMTKGNEWITRMTLQTLTWKNAYFVTLTYDSSSCSQDILDETLCCVSYCNEKHRKEVNAPLVLCKSHLQKFFKRLRKNTKKVISYYAVGEYGSTYCRPHYHLIMWCDDVISKQDIIDAWTVDGNQIGNIDFNDIKNNTTIKVDGTQYNPYGYVTKYVTKNFQVDFHYLRNSYLHKANIDKIIIDKNDKKKDETDDEYRYRKYYDKYRPFSVSSKKHAIGGRYLAQNIARFAEGDFRLFGIQDKNLIYPSYFYRKTRDYIIPIRTVVEDNSKDWHLSSTPNYVQSISTHDSRVQNNPRYISDDYEGFEHPLKYLRRKHVFGILNFYDKKEQKFCMYNQDKYNILKYNKHTRKWEKIEEKKTSEVYQILSKYWNRYVGFLESIRIRQSLVNNEKNELLVKEYNTDLQTAKHLLREDLLQYNEKFESLMYFHQLKYKQTKNKF